MGSNELVAMTERNIRQALCDYGAHTPQRAVLDDVGDAFIARLARDSVDAKSELRALLSKSPAWNEELQALVINGTRTHDPDFQRVHNLMYRILGGRIAESDSDMQKKIFAAMRFFDSPDLDSSAGIAAIKDLAPKAYRANKKKSRIFKSLCDALGITDETQGSDFQRDFAILADELNGRKIGFKLFVSINPAHFLTMSNPKCDERGNTLTSCHSFNSTEYSYNCGCAGYARDDVTMIAFTASCPDFPDTLNNRKTTRQLFMYKVRNGLLLQSRMYNTSGGTCGAQEDSELYRDLVQRELSELEGVPNLWKTYPYVGNSFCEILAGEDFGGYCDWFYKEFDTKISIRVDHADDFQAFKVGTSGLCISCGKQISSGLYCCRCKNNNHCDWCGERCSETWTVYDGDGEASHVCQDCLDEHYTCCDECGEYFLNDAMTVTSNGAWVCPECLDEYYCSCDRCGEYHCNDDIFRAFNRRGYEVWVCENCRDRYYECCDSCGEFFLDGTLCTVCDSNGDELSVCENCRNEHYAACDKCGRYFPKEAVENGLCPDCRSEQ